MRRKEDRLSDFVINQWESKIPIFKEMIEAYLNLIELAELMLDDNDYRIRFTGSYEIKINCPRKPKSSYVESLAIENTEDKPKLRDYILKYPNAFKEFTPTEKQIFILSFVNKFTDVQITEQLGYYSEKIGKIRKSVIVRFSIKLGFNRIMKDFR